MNLNGISLLFLFALAVIVGLVMVVGTSFLGKWRGNKARFIPYECGLDPVGSPRSRMPLKFFLVAVIFIIFDIEVVFLYPWAVVFRDFVADGKGVLMLVEMAVFLGILALGFGYLWVRGALEWEE
ncbi:MAG: NADH-quinone oxidoreductase subunit A [Deltaproteobacteria bacterium]|nr:NADH-quinone oxidoreductase subunit A [Deltaproteobacteria bacterium]